MIFFTLVWTASNSHADDIKCNSGGTQLEMNACARDVYKKADKELNQTYHALIKKDENDSFFIEKLRLSQKAWLVFQDAELEAYFACPEERGAHCWGSMYPMSFLHHKAELTRDRTKQLQRILKYGRGE